MVVLTTVASQRDGRELARKLVEERLAACVNSTAVGSTYRWKGKVEEDDERLLIIKTAEDLLARLEQRIAALSAYEVPEFVAIRPAAISDAYLAWLLDACPAAVARAG